MTRVRTVLAVVLLALFGWGAALAQTAAPSMTPHLESPRGEDAARAVPIGSYTLATFWLPQHCKQAIAGITTTDCSQMRTAGLMLHGLWPDGTGKDWPQWCKPADLLSPKTIAAHIASTPSAQQLQHEWAKHGTCMAGYTPDRYFDRAEQLYHAIHIPDLRALSYRDATIGSVKQAIAAANPGLTVDMFKLTLDKQGWLKEVWFCLDTKFAPRACAEPQREPQDAKVQIWRGGHSSGGRTSSRRYDRGTYSDRRVYGDRYYDDRRSRSGYSRPYYG